MYLIVSYDITDNKTRKKVADKLIYIGMVRIQYSVFIGDIKNSLFNQLKIEAKILLIKSNHPEDKILILPLEKQLLMKSILLGKDEKIIENIIDKKNTLII